LDGTTPATNARPRAVAGAAAASGTIESTVMFQVLRKGDLPKGAIADVEFEGESYAAGVSFFVGDLPPGRGPRLHRHPYAETCIVRSGHVRMSVDDNEITAGPGDIVVLAPQAPHRFVAVGDEPLRMICIHASERFIIEWVDG
jgi:quercetin dioxygenase-like cupin family protein